MKIATFNLGNFGSTGTIVNQLGKVARESDYEYYSLFPSTKQDRPYSENDYVIENRFCGRITVILSHLFGLHGLLAFIPTIKAILFMKSRKVDIIHLHNLHDSYINLPMLFHYIKRQKIPVVWTLHDCWSFTGHCPYFELAKCEKWKDGCYCCPSFWEYPKSYVDNSKLMWKLKKKWFSDLENMTLVTPSQWLADLVKQSYLKGYPIKVINNGIDLSVFRPTDNDLRKRYNIPEEKNILLGVAFGWNKRKGLDVFIELVKRLNPEQYQIVLVGTDDETDRILPKSIISVHRTQNQQELAAMYSFADLFVNPTREENYPTVNMESIACGTPVLTFHTGGSPEIADETCGAVVSCDDIDAMEDEIIRICKTKPFTKEDCLKRSIKFDIYDRYKEYLELYKEVTKSKW